MSTQKLSIIVPAYNEGSTIATVLDRLRTLSLIQAVTKEVIVVNDCSTDNTDAVIQAYMEAHPGMEMQYLTLTTNSGKGAALHQGIAAATGDFLVVQDADLEYDPEELNLLLKPILDDHADVVYGSRFFGGRPHRALFYWHTIGNKFLTRLSNLMTNLNLTDMETCYKMFRTEMVQGLRLKEKRFGFEPEVTAKISRIKGVRIYEVGISYYGRTFEDGKKITWKDGVRAIWCIVKYNIFQRK